MGELLDLAVKAHGGLARWNEVNTITVVASITGAIWYVKGKPDILKNVVITAETRRERVTLDFPGQDKRAIFRPDRVVIEKLDGTLIEARDNPEESFAGQQRETPWDDIQVAYFAGEALWTYLNTPFLYTHEGFKTEEIAPLKLETETWRRLKVTFPDNVTSHTREQILCFGHNGLLRRHDYTVDILGGAPGFNYAFDFRNVDGIVFPTKRRVFAYEGDYQPVTEPLLVAIDLGQINRDEQGLCHWLVIAFVGEDAPLGGEYDAVHMAVVEGVVEAGGAAENVHGVVVAAEQTVVAEAENLFAGVARHVVGEGHFQPPPGFGLELKRCDLFRLESFVSAKERSVEVRPERFTGEVGHLDVVPRSFALLARERFFWVVAGFDESSI